MGSASLFSFSDPDPALLPTSPFARANLMIIFWNYLRSQEIDSLSILAIHNLYFLTSSEWFIILSALTGSRDTPSWDSATARCTGWWSGNISLIIRGRVSMMVTMTRSQNKFGWSPFSPVTSFQTVARAGADKKRKQASVLDSQGDADMLLNMLLLYPMT